MEAKGIGLLVSGEISAVGENAIEILKNDHVALKSVLDALRDAPLAQRESLFERLKALFIVHNATEENLVYPAINEIARRPLHAGRLFRQHDEIKAVLWELSLLDPRDPEFTVRVSRLREALFGHIQTEEENEFPRLREAGEEHLEWLTEDVRRFRRSFTFTPRE